MTTQVVVGGGPSGLGTALTLAQETGSEVHLVDRIPVLGGESGWDNSAIRELASRAERSGIRLHLGDTATHWLDGVLHLVGPEGSSQIRADRLFYAGGRRPATAADLRFGGDRPAGVLPATVAEHLLTSGVALWKRPLIVGNGPWAPHIAHVVHGYGGHVIALDGSSAWADETYDRRGAVEVRGRGRVETVLLHNDGATLSIDCDAVILAAGPFPNRNIVGALAEPSDSVTFVQPLDSEGIDERFRAAQTATRAWIHTTGGTQ